MIADNYVSIIVIYHIIIDYVIYGTNMLEYLVIYNSLITTV